MQIPGVKGVPRNAKSVSSLVKRLKIDPELVRSHLAPDPTLDRFTRDNYFSDPGGPLAPDQPPIWRRYVIDGFVHPRVFCIPRPVDS